MVENICVKPQRIFLYSLVLSVIVSALLGIGALLSGTFGEFQLKVLFTTLTVAVGSVMGLACGAGLEREAGHLLARCGIWLVLLAGVMMLTGLWTPLDYNNDYWKATASVAVWAGAVAHLALISRARLAPRFGWYLLSAYLLIPLLAIQVTIGIITQAELELLGRVVGVTAILVAANTILIEIFHRLSSGETATRGRPPLHIDRATIDAEIQRLKARITELEGLRRQA